MDAEGIAAGLALELDQSDRTNSPVIARYFASIGVFPTAPLQAAAPARRTG